MRIITEAHNDELQPGLKIERARGPEARKMAVGPASLSSWGPDGPAAILLGTFEFFTSADLTDH